MTTERPATADDMARFWPDKTPDELAAARTAIEAAGATMTVTAASSSHDDECEAEWIPGAMSWTTCRCDERLDNEDGADR